MKKPVTYIALAMVLFVVITMTSSAISFVSEKEKYESIPEEKILWNLREMKLTEGKPAQKTLDVYKKLAAVSEDEIPKGIKIDWARANGNDILVVFERYRYLNSNLDRDYIAVFDTQGRYQYGFEGYLITKGKNEIAFSPDQDGIMIRNWRFSSIAESTYLLVEPDGTALPLQAVEYWGQDPEVLAYWNSDYKVVDTANCRLVIRNTITSEESVVFDYSDAYTNMYPHSSKIDSEKEKILNGLVPVFFFLIMLFVFPWMIKHQEQESSSKTHYGDLRDRWK